VARFECRLDGASFSPCTSPLTYSSLALGRHTVEVCAIDTSNNADPTPARLTWTVDAPPPRRIAELLSEPVSGGGAGAKRSSENERSVTQRLCPVYALRVVGNGPDAVHHVLPTRFEWPLFGVALLAMAAPVAGAARQRWGRTRP